MFTIKMRPAVPKILTRLSKNFDKNVRYFLIDLSRRWQAETQKNLSGSTTTQFPAYRTGTLFRSVLAKGPQIGTAPTFNAKLSVFADYAGYLEKGTSKMVARPYAKPAFDKIWKKMPNRLLKLLIRRG